MYNFSIAIAKLGGGGTPRAPITFFYITVLLLLLTHTDHIETQVGLANHLSETKFKKYMWLKSYYFSRKLTIIVVLTFKFEHKPALD